MCFSIGVIGTFKRGGMHKSNEILRGLPCKIHANSAKVNEILKVPPLRIHVDSTISHGNLRGFPCQMRVNLIGCGDTIGPL